MLAKILTKIAEMMDRFGPICGTLSYVVVLTLTAVLVLFFLFKMLKSTKTERNSEYDKLEDATPNVVIQSNAITSFVGEPNVPPLSVFELHEIHVRFLLSTATLSQPALPFVGTNDRESVDIADFACPKGRFDILQGTANRLWSFLPDTYQVWGRIGRADSYALVQSTRVAELVNEYAWYELLKETGISLTPVSISGGAIHRTMIVVAPNIAYADLYAQGFDGENPDWAGVCIDGVIKTIKSVAELHKVGIVHGSINSLAVSTGAPRYLLSNFRKVAPISQAGICADLNAILTMFVIHVDCRPDMQLPALHMVMDWWHESNILRLPFHKYRDDPDDYDFMQWDTVEEAEVQEAQRRDELREKALAEDTLREQLLKATAPVFRDIMVAAVSGDAPAMIKGFDTLNKVRRL